MKLPVSGECLIFDFTEPARYGLGRPGRISCRFPEGEAPDLDLMKRWIAESYRAVAPKKLGTLMPE